MQYVLYLAAETLILTTTNFQNYQSWPIVYKSWPQHW